MALEDLNSVDSDIRVVQQTTVEQMVNKILGERFEANGKRKLTWNEKTRQKTPGDRRIGTEGLNRRLEHNQIGRNVWFIQNGKIYDGAGKVKKLEEVDEYWRPYVKEIYENHKRQALSVDDSLCPRCFEHGDVFVSASHEEYMTHNLDKHPEVATKILSALPKAEPKIKIVEPPADAGATVIDFQNSPQITYTVKTFDKAAASTNFVCNTCGKSVKTEHGLKVHTARIHKG
jgi:hypothetical protein